MKQVSKKPRLLLPKAEKLLDSLGAASSSSRAPLGQTPLFPQERPPEIPPYAQLRANIINLGEPKIWLIYLRTDAEWDQIKGLMEVHHIRGGKTLKQLVQMIGDQLGLKVLLVNLALTLLANFLIVHSSLALLQ